jgi:hypothetical protein
MQMTPPAPVVSPNAGYIHESNINNAGRDYIDNRQINHFNLEAERGLRYDLDSRQRE